MIRRWFFILMAVNIVFVGLFCWEEWTPEWKDQFWRYRELKLAALHQELEQAVAHRDAEGNGLAGLRASLAAEEARLALPRQKAELERLTEALAEAQERLEDAVDNYQKNYSAYQTLEIRYHQMADDHPDKELRGADLRKLGLRLEHMKAEEDRITTEVENLDGRLSGLIGERQRLNREIKRAESEVEQVHNSIATLEAQRPAIEQVSNTELGRVDRCITCHLGIEDPQFADAPEPLSAHQALALVDIGRYHPFRIYGCTICHEGQGLATRLAEAFGKEAHFHQPVLGKDLTQGSCLPCHPERIPFPGIPALEAAPLLEQGRKLFADKGCTGCHETEPFKNLTRIGPRLNSIRHKVGADWLYRWLRKPADYLPATNMPDFLLPPEEIREITDYLLLKLAEQQPPPAPPPPVGSDRAYENGREIFQLSRCITCHALEGRGGTIGPDLSRVASKLNRDWLFSWLDNPPAHDQQTLMPHFRFTARQRLDLMEYISQEFVDWDLPDAPDAVGSAAPLASNAARGEVLVGRYGCSGCHEMPGSSDSQKVSTELTDYGTKTVDLLDFGWAWDIARTRLDWTMTKLRTPRLFRDTLLMPNYTFTEEDILALTTLLLALKGNQPPQAYIYQSPRGPLSMVGPRMASPPPVTEFERLVDDLRCRSCHRLGTWGGTLAPELDLVGSRFEGDYLRFFLKTPEAIRPLLVERMVRLNLTDREVDLLVEGLRFISTNQERVPPVPADPPATTAADAEGLYRSLGCNGCHMIGAAGGTSGPNLTETGRRLTLDYLTAWLRGPQALVPAAIEPNYGLSEGDAALLARWLKQHTGEGGQ